VKEANSATKYRTLSAAGSALGGKQPSVLTAMAGSAASLGGVISTKSSHSISADAGVVGGKGKGLNEVQGRVSRRMNEFSLAHDGSNVTQDKLAIKARSIVFI
jgi:hypothetical protein